MQVKVNSLNKQAESLKLITFGVFFFQVIEYFKSAQPEKMDNIHLCTVICNHILKSPFLQRGEELDYWIQMRQREPGRWSLPVSFNTQEVFDKVHCMVLTDGWITQRFITTEVSNSCSCPQPTRNDQSVKWLGSVLWQIRSRFGTQCQWTISPEYGADLDLSNN